MRGSGALALPSVVDRRRRSWSSTETHSSILNQPIPLIFPNSSDVMWYSWLADLILSIHAGFVLFVIFGGLLVLRWRWIAWLHLPAALWGAVVEFSGWVCPLTPLEINVSVYGWLWRRTQWHRHRS